VHTAENASITVAEAAELWIQTGEPEKLASARLCGNIGITMRRIT
jgi:hypothetical protein